MNDFLYKSCFRWLPAVMNLVNLVGISHESEPSVIIFNNLNFQPFKIDFVFQSVKGINVYIIVIVCQKTYPV